MRDEERATQVTVATLRNMKREGEKIAALTAYDASFGALLDDAGVDLVLVGDSLGMVVQGQESTVPVSMEDMLYHTRIVARGCKRPLLVADMPFMSYATPESAMENAARLMREGHAQMVKLEGGHTQIEVVRMLADRGIPICAHLGLQPQSVHKIGGYKVQGRVLSEAQSMAAAARELENAGADVLILECVPSSLAAEISAEVGIPVIGIGAGSRCDGQVLVLYDILGVSSDRVPRFVRNFMPEAEDVRGAVAAYVAAVKSGEFPAPEHSFD